MNRDDMDFNDLARDLGRKGEAKSPSPQFTRRHYIWLANAMRLVFSNCLNFHSRVAVKIAIEEFANALAAENPHFDKQKFLSNIFNPEQPK